MKNKLSLKSNVSTSQETGKVTFTFVYTGNDGEEKTKEVIGNGDSHSRQEIVSKTRDAIYRETSSWFSPFGARVAITTKNLD